MFFFSAHQVSIRVGISFFFNVLFFVSKILNNWTKKKKKRFSWTGRSALLQIEQTNKPINEQNSTTLKEFIAIRIYSNNWKTVMSEIRKIVDDEIKNIFSSSEIKWWHKQPNKRKKQRLLMCKQINLKQHALLNKKWENTKNVTLERTIHEHHKCKWNTRTRVKTTKKNREKFVSKKKTNKQKTKIISKFRLCRTYHTQRLWIDRRNSVTN